ncbi:MAG TPA: CDP-alcohol phosphatidyltransferase family protein, partial [Acidobacteriota bacterium]|nr:CDP-alcohol phosphatidyltransferase family protein [Acidobacteriota bacterium]
MSTPQSFKDAQRSQQSFLAPLEKRVLVWMAERLPAWINPDHLTGLGFLAMLGVGLSYWYASQSRLGLMLASVWLVVNWFGDSLDGTVARVRNQLRPRYGFYVDHICDAFGTCFMLGGLALSGYMSPPVAAALLITYLMLNI